MIQYVNGFLFDDSEQRVVLIRKLRPEWQKGKLNGVGGKAEFGETFDAAMAREFREEAGVFIPAGAWDEFAVVRGEEFAVHFYRFASTRDLEKVRTVETEKVGRYQVDDVLLGMPDMIPNLQWLVPMALRVQRKDWPFSVTERQG